MSSVRYSLISITPVIKDQRASPIRMIVMMNDLILNQFFDMKIKPPVIQPIAKSISAIGMIRTTAQAI